MADIKDPKRLAAAIDRHLMRYDYQEVAFTNGWRQFESGIALRAPYQLGPDTRSYFILGYGDAAGTPDPVPIDARSYFAAAALQGCCANQGEYLDLNTKELAAVCWRFADAMLAAIDEKDGSAAA